MSHPSGSYNSQTLKILKKLGIIIGFKQIMIKDRNMKKINNTNFSSQGSPYPENEDLNEDNTLSDTESYYEYEVNLRPGDLEIGKNNIVDKIIDKSGEATWYQFRIPIRNPIRTYGSISDFKTIRFIRTYLTDWEAPVVLRFAKFQMVGSQWRKYEELIWKIKNSRQPLCYL